MNNDAVGQHEQGHWKPKVQVRRWQEQKLDVEEKIKFKTIQIEMTTTNWHKEWQAIYHCVRGLH
jgi:hypothetical protein